MKTLRIVSLTLMGALFLGGLTVSAPAQQAKEHELQKQQQQFKQIEIMMQRLNSLSDRAHQLVESLPNESIKKEPQTMEHFQALQHMNQSISTMVDQLKETLGAYKAMMQNKDFIREKASRKGMEELRSHLKSMLSQLEGAVKIAEDLMKRLYMETGQKPFQRF